MRFEDLRTPDSRFDNLPDFPFSPHYCEVNDPTAPHCESTISMKVRRARVPFCSCTANRRGHFSIADSRESGRARASRVAPDLVGFGRSDKPVEQSDYTFERHVEWMSDWLAATRPHEHHALLPGLGRTDRTAAGGGFSRKVRARGRGEYRTADRRGIQRSDFSNGSNSARAHLPYRSGRSSAWDVIAV